MASQIGFQPLSVQTLSMNDYQQPGVAMTESNWRQKKVLRWVGSADLNSGDRWQNLRVMRLRHTCREAFLQPLPYHLILLYQGHPSRQQTRFAGKTLNFLQTKNDVTITPAFTTMRSWYDETEQEDVYLHLPLDFVRNIALGLEMNPDRVELIPAFCQRSPQIEHLAWLAVDELETGGHGGDLYADSLATALTVQLLRNFSTQKLLLPRLSSGLPPQLLRRSTDFINDNLEENFSLAALAAHVGVSPYYLARLFKQSTGRTPHQYLIERRIEKAKRLLVERSDLSIVELAYELGFANHSHFTKFFHRLVGITPKDYREALEK